MPSIDIDAKDIVHWFLALPAGWQIMIALAAAFVVPWTFWAWLMSRYYNRQFAHQIELKQSIIESKQAQIDFLNTKLEGATEKTTLESDVEEISLPPWISPDYRKLLISRLKEIQRPDSLQICRSETEAAIHLADAFEVVFRESEWPKSPPSTVPLQRMPVSKGEIWVIFLLNDHAKISGVGLSNALTEVGIPNTPYATNTYEKAGFECVLYIADK